MLAHIALHKLGAGACAPPPVFIFDDCFAGCQKFNCLIKCKAIEMTFKQCIKLCGTSFQTVKASAAAVEVGYDIIVVSWL